MLKQRKISESDFPAIAAEIAKDPAHRGWMQPSFFTEPHTGGLVVEDDHGPVFYLRLSHVLRVHVQFCDVEKQRIRDAMIEEMKKVKELSAAKGYRQIIFDSVSRGLIAFCKRYLKFIPSPDEYVLWLDVPPPPSVESSTDGRTIH